MKQFIIKKNVNFNCSLDEFYQILLANNSSSLFGMAHEQTGDTDIDTSSWQSKENDNIMERIITYTHPLNILFYPSSCRNEQTQTLQRFGDAGFCVMSSTLTIDLVIVDSFRLQEYLLVSSNDEGGISISIVFYVCFLKSTFMNGIITKTSINDSLKFYDQFMTNVKHQICKLSTKSANDPSKVEWDAKNDEIEEKAYSNKVTVVSDVFL